MPSQFAESGTKYNRKSKGIFILNQKPSGSSRQRSWFNEHPNLDGYMAEIYLIEAIASGEWLLPREKDEKRWIY